MDGASTAGAGSGIRMKLYQRQEELVDPLFVCVFVKNILSVWYVIGASGLQINMESQPGVKYVLVPAISQPCAFEFQLCFPALMLLECYAQLAREFSKPIQ